MTINFAALMDATVAADATAAAEATGPASWTGMLPTVGMLAVMIVVFYFFLIRPQKKKDKAVKDMLAALKVSDRVCTIGGIYGTVTAIKDDTVTIAVGAQKAQLVVARWGIRSVEDAPLENEKEALV